MVGRRWRAEAGEIQGCDCPTPPPVDGGSRPPSPGHAVPPPHWVIPFIVNGLAEGYTLSSGSNSWHTNLRGCKLRTRICSQGHASPSSEQLVEHRTAGHLDSGYSKRGESIMKRIAVCLLPLVLLLATCGVRASNVAPMEKAIVTVDWAKVTGVSSAT